ncbi:MAG: hypothetical protein V7636_214 [Actinomycetota bacterium]
MVALVLLASLVAACGSTAQTSGESSTAAAGGTNNAGLSPATTAGNGVGGAATGGSGVAAGGSSGATGSSGGGARSTGGASGSSGSGVGASGASAGPVGPGVTDKTIALGIPYCNDCAAANAALGAGGENPGDTRRYAQAAIDDLNKRGGVAGRKVVPVFHEISASDDISRSQQEVCDDFTADHKVLMIFFRGEIIYECAKKAGILTGGGDATGPVFEKYPNLFAPASIRLERLFQNTVRSMVKLGWNKPSAKWPTGKIGLLTWDTPEYRYAMDHGYLAGLKEAGLKAAEVRYIAVPANADSIAESSAAISNAVLAFRSEGIDHVFIGDGQAGIFAGAGLTFLFLSNAKSQSYFPRYGFNSNNAPDFDSHPKDELVGMIAIDSFDTDPKNDEGIAPNAPRERCFEIMRKAGLPVGQGQTQAIAIGSCEGIWFAEAVISRAADTTLPNMIAAGESLGTSYRSPYNFGNRIGPGQHDGVALFRSLEWGQDCSCIVYTSKPFEP